MRAALRIFLKGLLFATRPKRRVVAFAVSFTFLSALTFVSISLAEQGWTVDLRRDTAVWVTQKGWTTARLNDADAILAALGDRGEALHKRVLVRYLDYRGMRILGVDVSSPWASDLVNPGKVARGGRFIRARTGEAVTAGFFRCADPGARVSPTEGSRLTLRAGEKEKELKVVGEIRAHGDSKPWIVLSKEDFDDIRPERMAVYVYEVILLARGSAALPTLFGNPYENVEKIRKGLSEKASATGGRSWLRPASGLEETGRKSVSAARLAMLIAGALGGFAVSLMYGYIISRFRVREAAVLKAMGYASWQVGLLLVAEVVLVAGIGCLVGLVGVRTYFIKAALPSFVSTPAFFTLLAIFLLNCLGFFLVAVKAASVQPMELFRRKE